MVVGTGIRTLPIHRTAWIGFSVSLLALVLAWYGSLHGEKHIPHSPLRDARGAGTAPPEPGPWYERLLDKAEVSILGGRVDQKVLALTERSKIARYSLEVVAFGLPFLLGLAATYTGATAMKVIEQSQGKYSGNFQAVFSIMIGGFASVIAGCMILSIFIWPHVPSLYTH